MTWPVKLNRQARDEIARMLSRNVQPSVIAVHFRVSRQWVTRIKQIEAGSATDQATTPGRGTFSGHTAPAGQFMENQTRT